jgi:hypothetical protein
MPHSTHFVVFFIVFFVEKSGILFDKDDEDDDKVAYVASPLPRSR